MPGGSEVASSLRHVSFTGASQFSLIGKMLGIEA